MKTLTVTISDETAAKLEQAVAGGRHTVEEAAAHAIEDAYADDWLADLTPEDRAAIEEGVAEAERGEFATDEEIKEAFDRFNRRRCGTPSALWAT